MYTGGAAEGEAPLPRCIHLQPAGENHGHHRPTVQGGHRGDTVGLRSDGGRHVQTQVCHKCILGAMIFFAITEKTYRIHRNRYLKQNMKY